jgi:hypothetical protein
VDILNGYRMLNGKKIKFFTCHYLHNHSTSDVCIFGYVDVIKLRDVLTRCGILFLVHSVNYQTTESSETFFNILLGHLDS